MSPSPPELPMQSPMQSPARAKTSFCAKWSLKRLSVYAGSAVVFLTLAGGLLHTPLGRPLLARLGLRCPVQASPEDIEAARRSSARLQRGSQAAASRPALGFALDEMTRSDVEAWAEREHVTCESVRAGLLRCSDVPARAVGDTGPAINRLDLGFSLAHEQLVNVSAWRTGLTAEAASAELGRVVRSMKQRVGAPTSEAGSQSAEYLAAGPLHTAVARYRYHDYIADVSATNLAERGLLVREHYMSARD